MDDIRSTCVVERGDSGAERDARTRRTLHEKHYGGYGEVRVQTEQVEDG